MFSPDGGQVNEKAEKQADKEMENPSDSQTLKPTTMEPFRSVSEQYNNKLYGAFWLLEQISMQKGVYDDLMETFQGNIAQVHEIMSLAFFSFLTGRCFSRFAK